MDSRDRTFEYHQAINSLKSRQLNYSESSKPNKNALVKQANMFSLSARQIGKDLTNTYSKLEKLTLLASSKSMFDDKTMEIQELTGIIKQDISSMNSQLMELQKHKSQYTNHNKHVEKHSNSILISLQSKLASISNEFKGILEVRSENLKQQKTRQNRITDAGKMGVNHNLNHSNNNFSNDTSNFGDRQPLLNSNDKNANSPSFLRFRKFEKSLVNNFVSNQINQQQQNNFNFDNNADANVPSTSKMSNNPAEPFKQRPKNIASPYNDHNNYPQSPNTSEAVAIYMPSTMQKQQQLMQHRDQGDAYLESRADAVQTIESTIVELGTIFTQLAHMVKEQDEIIQRIDANVEDAHFSIEAAHTEILKYFQSLSSNRWLMIKIFGILVVFVIIFVLLFA